MTLIANATAALGLVLAATPALAQQTQQRTAIITTSDINLATPQGQKELNWRINRAIRNVCQLGYRDMSGRILTDDAKTCIAKARSSAQAQVARLTASEAQKGG